MRDIGCWGTHLEIKAAVTMFKESIYVATDTLVLGQCKWIVFPPFQILSLPDLLDFTVSYQKSWLEVAYTGGYHCDGVLPIQSEKPLIPPTLTRITLIYSSFSRLL